jgi:O-antigen ligase
MTMAAGIVATAVMLAALILTFSRTALFAAGIAAAFAFVRHASSRRSALKYVITVALICFVAIAFRMLGPDNAISSAGSDSDHAAFLILGMRAFAHNPLTGVGLGNIRWNTDGSNLLVQWLAEFGIGGGLLLAALIVAIIRCLRGRSARITAVGAPLLGIALAGLSDVPFGVVGHPASTCAVGLLLGATMALPAEIRSCRPSVVSERNSSASVGTDDLAEPDKIPVC